MKKVKIKKDDKIVTLIEQNNLIEALDEKQDKCDAFSKDYNDLRNKPTTMDPSPHEHTVSDITDFAHTHKSLENAGIILANQNLNSYTTPGIYTCSSTNAGSLTNKPYTENQSCMIEVLNYDDNTIVQCCHVVSSSSTENQLFYRVKNNNQWSDWTQLGGTQKIPGQINNVNNDLNNYTSKGEFVCLSYEDAQKLSNTPWGNQSNQAQAFSLIVLDTAFFSNKKGVTQILKDYDINSNNIYTRNYYNGWGSWKKFATISDIPTNISQLIDDSNFISKNSTAGLIKNDGTIDQTPYAVSSQIPTKTSQLTNDSNYATTSQIPTKTSQLTNDSNFTTGQIPTKTSQLTNDSNFAITSQIPTKTSQLTNDSSFATTSQIPQANTDATKILKNGTQSAGDLSTYAKANHVHPINDGTEIKMGGSGTDANISIQSAITSISNSVDDLKERQYEVSDILIRLVRLDSQGNLYSQDTEETYEGSKLEVNRNDKLTVKAISRSGQNLSGLYVTFGLSGSTVKTTTIGTGGYANDTITLGNGDPHLAFAVLKGNASRRKAVDLAYIPAY